MINHQICFSQKRIRRTQILQPKQGYCSDFTSCSRTCIPDIGLQLATLRTASVWDAVKCRFNDYVAILHLIGSMLEQRGDSASRLILPTDPGAMGHFMSWYIFLVRHMLINQYGNGSKPCSPGEHQNRWQTDVHPLTNCIYRY